MQRTITRKRHAERFGKLARKFDAIAVRLARGRPAIDVALGEIFLTLSEGDRLLDLNRSKQADFTHEDLGLPARKFFSLKELAEGLRERPILRQAVIAGAVSPLKAEAIMDLAVGEHEAAFTAAAMEMTVAGLRSLARECGGEAPDPEGPRMETLYFRMTPEQQDRLDYAMSLAKEVVGYDAPRHQLAAEIGRDWLSRRRVGGVGEGGATEGDEGAPGRDHPPCDSIPESSSRLESWLLEMGKKKDEVARQLGAMLEARAILEPAQIIAPEQNAFGLLAAARHLLARREKFDEPLGRVLFRIHRLELWWWLGFSSFGEYCRERLGMSESTAKERIRLERRMELLPPLRVALKSGRITYSKALQIARHATPGDVLDLIADAASTTFQKTREKADAERDRRDRERGERTVRGPSASIEVVREAIVGITQKFAVEGERIDDGEAQKRLADAYIDQWEVPLRRQEWRTKWEKDVLLRHGGLCAVPGCTRAAKHLHHIVFREHGGPTTPLNLLATCWAHHKLCIHRGILTVRGRAGQHLVWVFRDQELVPYEEWETWGADDVRVPGRQNGRVPGTFLRLSG